ncbi:hypothetical protein ACFXAZ_26110 [Streptomyces sp. NPDC059477]|uniref:hypothetical protein n=1 Tax=Streptomyces sp. NPDC059477 TaxID=3346847 RepID=UPI003681B99B
MDLILYLGGGAVALLAIGAVGKGVWRANRRVVTIVDLVQELSPNSGHSIKDQVTRTAEDVAETKESVTELTRRFDEHLAEHPTNP